MPLLAVIALIFLDGNSFGLSVKDETAMSLGYNSISMTSMSYDSGTPVARTLTISNDYFLPRKVEIPRVVGCLSDKEGISAWAALRVTYIEESPPYGTKEPIDIPDSDYYNPSSRLFVEVPAHGEKRVSILVRVYDYFDKTTYGDYDEVLLFEANPQGRYFDSYTYCQDLDGTSLEKAVHIPITKQ
ncbi:hypothetical protein A3K63_02640 [Candidatus Micrarchaeota archaeon RBG_16_49_10]|nr:MAG: hypothetical protein A3K63_02640 [Candidatus Micrarchaeota archaeon RBG_16_49_10]